MFGLSTQDIDLLVETLRRYPDIEEAIVFGSRAIGNYKEGSDVDIALKGNLLPETSSKIYVEFNEHLPLPYKFDVIAYSAISHKPLLEHIDTHGKTLYRKL